jgi:phage tail sheath protein FI
MPNYVSPGVYTIEKDISDFAPSINTSIVGIVGFASKGPTNTATLITDQNKLLKTFGFPNEDIVGQALEGALEILETTNSVYFVRAANDSAVDASATMSVGLCPAVIVSGPPAVDAGGVPADCFGGTGTNASALTLRIQSYDNNGVAQFTENAGAGKDFTIVTGTADSQALALRNIVGGSLDADKVGVFDDGSTRSGLGLSGAVVGSFAGSGASISISACTGSTFNAANGVSALRAVNGPSGVTSFGASGALASSVRSYGTTFVDTGANSCSYVVESLHPGTGYNGGTKANGDTSGNSVTLNGLGAENFSVVINQDGVAEETFKANFLGSGVYLEDVINTGETNTTSEIIKGNLRKDGADATAAKLQRFIGTAKTIFGAGDFNATTRFLDPATNPDGTGTPVTKTAVTDAGGRFVKLIQSAATNLAGGTNGDDTDQTSALIGDASQDPKTGMQALDDPLLNIGVALVPGIYTQAVQNELVTLAERTQNFLALLAPPLAIGNVQAAIDWTNGKSASTANSRTAALNSSYAAVYWPHVKIFSVFDGKDRFLDPSIFGARQMAFTDAVADSWFAPAGFRRGRLTKPTETEVKLNQGDRDSLYSGGNVINPIVNFPQQGITIFGQRTTQRNPTALDRINIRRLMIYIRKVILLSTQRFVFEPNDSFTWAQIEGVLNPFLDDIRKRRGITEFRVVCDETVNTPVRVDRNELWTKVLIKPTKTAEILIFEINLTNQSAQLGNL